MRDVFYTILVVWIIWRVLDGISLYTTKQPHPSNNTQKQKQKEGETTVEYIPPTKKKFSDDAGEYVDYEELK